MFSNQKGFTLIEMLIVIAVISLLLILFIPNLADKNSAIQDKGCEALVELAENQMIAYQLDHQTSITSANDLVDGEYIKSVTCSNGTKMISYAGEDSDPAFDIVNVVN